MKILTFAAALRKDSLNRKLIHQADLLLKQNREIELDAADFRAFEMPMYDGDFEESEGIPKGAQELIKRVRAADAVIISTPEYNGGIPGTLKNALDWASRDEAGIPFDGKPLLFLGASPGGFGAVRGLWHTRVPFEAIGAYVYPELFGLPKAHQAFDDQGGFKDEKTKARLESLLRDFVDYSKRLSGNIR